MPKQLCSTHVARIVRTPLPDWVVPGFARSRSLTLVSAAGGTSKSILCTYAAFCAAACKPFFDWPAPRHEMRVTMVGVDAPVYDYAHVFRRLAYGMGVPLIPPMGQRTWKQEEAVETYGDEAVAYGWPPFRILTGSVFDMPPEKVLAQAKHAAIEGPTSEPDSYVDVLPDLIIVDSLSATHGGDENAATDMKTLMLGWRRVAEAGPAVVLIHHHGKPKGEAGKNYHSHHDARGSSVIHDSVDMHLTLYTGTERQDWKTINARWRKGRGADLPPKWAYRIRWDARQLRLEREAETKSNAARANPDAPDEPPDMLAVMDPDTEYTWPELMRLANKHGKASPMTLSKLIKPLVASGQIVKVRHGKMTHWTLPLTEPSK